jgi:uncharacterized protein (DUF2236 family)
MSITNWVTAAPLRLRQRINRGIRDAAGLSNEPPPACNDPAEAYLPVNGVARLVHGDLPPMMIGGVASLFFEMLHPHTMAGVADHSRYRQDPLGRVLQTANFIGATSYGSKANAYAAIERVLAIHQGVRGVADDGVAYYANDPHLLRWVHCAGSSMFLSAYQCYGQQHLTSAQADQYVREVAATARDMGVIDPPTNVEDLNVALAAFRPELRLSADGMIARDFIAKGVVGGAHQRVAYRLIVDAAYALMEPWALELLGVASTPVVDRLIVRPAAALLSSAVRIAVPPARPVTLTD